MTDDTKTVLPDQGEIRPKQSSPKRKSSTAKGAAALLAQMRSKEEEAKLDKEIEIDTENDWYVVCHRCDGPAIFLTKHSETGFIPPETWFANYKNADQPYYNSNVMCQCCRKTITAKMHQDGTIEIHPRMIRSPQDQEKRLAEANLERRRIEAMAKAKISVMDGEVIE